MGIHQLNKLLQQRASESIQTVTYEMLQNKVVAVDIAMWTYAFATTTAIADASAMTVKVDEDAIEKAAEKAADSSVSEDGATRWPSNGRSAHLCANCVFGGDKRKH